MSASLATSSPGATPARVTPHSARPVGLVAVWLLSLVVIGWVMMSERVLGPPSVARGAIALTLNLASTVVLVRWLGPVPTQQPDALSSTHKGRLALMLAAVVVVMFPLGAAGPVVLVPLTLAAAVVLFRRRKELAAREPVWALVFALLAGAAGVLNGFALHSRNDVAFGILMFPLVLFTLLAGWVLVRRADWPVVGAGRTLVLSAGIRPALGSFAFGFLLALPWALGSVINGAPEGDHVTSGWQAVVAALQPAVSEEAWGRVFLVVGLFLILRRVAQDRTAMSAAVAVSTLWFAFLHTPANPVAAVLLAAIYVLPMTYLWLRRGLEAAIGFHFCADLVRFLVAYLAFAGLWFI